MMRFILGILWSLPLVALLLSALLLILNKLDWWWFLIAAGIALFVAGNTEIHIK